LTLFLNAHGDRLAPGSFQQPVTIPASPPGAPDLVQVCFNKDWLPYVLGCLFQLTLSTTWQASTQDELLSALQAANDLILIFTLAKDGCAVGPTGPEGISGDEMCCCLRMQDGVLQLFSCGEWTDVPGWDKSAIAPNQPGVGAIQPASGQCQNFTGAIGPTNPWLLPVPVNAGDVVTVTNLNGSWSPSAFTTIWLCPDGNLFFAGVCVDGTQAFDSGAPMPTAPLNGTVLFDGTNYYDVSMAANPNTPVAITIASGVSNAQLVVRCNFHGGTDPAGEVLFGIQVCNNNTPNWSSTFDFTLTNGSWIESELTGHWTPGQGWFMGADAVGGPNSDINITPTVPFALTSYIVNYNAAADLTSATPLNRARGGSGGATDLIDPLFTGTGVNTKTYVNAAGLTTDNLDFRLLDSSAFGGDVVVTSVIINGKGAKPTNFP